MTARRVLIQVNGILTRPGDAEGWTDRGVTWWHLHTGWHAEKYEYAAGVLTRRLHQQSRAEGLARMADFYQRAGWEVSFVAHSNGADIVARVLALLIGRPPFTVRSCHLVAPAADVDTYIAAIRTGTLAHLSIYGSPGDRALRLARLSRKAGGWLGLGYGSMGLDPLAAAEAIRSERVQAVVMPTYDHATWFERGARFEATMQMIHEREVAIDTARLHDRFTHEEELDA